jgi:hypothetical protein
MTPRPAASRSGLKTMLRATSLRALRIPVVEVPLNAITSGTITNISRASKEKMRATGTDASGPSVASARPGPI